MFRKITKGICILFALIFFAVAFPVSPVEAQNEPEDPEAKIEYPLLEEIHQKLLEIVEQQHAAFENIESQIVDAEIRIKEQQAEGQDTTILEEALAIFENEVKSSQRYHELGEQILKSHPGFNDDGKVTNAFVVKETLSIAVEYLRDAGEILKSASDKAKKAMQEYQEALPKNKEQLEEGYQMALTALETTQNNIEKFEEVLIKAEEKLAELETAGKDVSEYQEKLETLQTDLSNLQAEYQAVSILIEEHDGFDDEGKAIDLDEANTTISTIRDLFENMQNALIDIRDRWQERQYSSTANC